MREQLELHVEGLEKAFPATVVLRGVSLVARPGEATVVTGAPGAGRTTLARCLTGAYRPDAGTVVLTDGRSRIDLATADARTLVWLRRHHVAVLDGALPAPPRQRAVDAVARAAGVGHDAASVALERVGAAACIDVPVGRLRGPARRSVALAAALAGEQPLVVLDEPDRSAAVDDWVEELALAGRTVVVTADESSHEDGRAAAGPDATERGVGPHNEIRRRTGRLEQGVLTWRQQ